MRDLPRTPALGRPAAAALAALAALVGATIVVSCSSSGPGAAPTTTKPKITNASDARQRIDQLQRRGDCLEEQAAYLEIKSEPIALASDPSKAKVDKFHADVEALRPKMPEPALEDYDLVTKAYEAVIGQLDGLDLSDPTKAQQNAPKARDALRALDEPTVKQAEGNLESYFKSCLAQQQ